MYARIKSEYLAMLAYETYCAAVGGVAFNGDPLPNWFDFYADASKEVQVSAWIKVAERLTTHDLESDPFLHWLRDYRERVIEMEVDECDMDLGQIKKAFDQGLDAKESAVLHNWGEV